MSAGEQRGSSLKHSGKNLDVGLLIAPVGGAHDPVLDIQGHGLVVVAVVVAVSEIEP